MLIKKFTLLIALISLAATQIALAEHSSTHIDHRFSLEITSAHDGHDHEEQQEHQCPECILTKSLLTAYYNAPSILNLSLKADNFTVTSNVSVFSKSYFNSNAPRAPPSILI